MKIGSRFWLILALLMGFVLSNVSCGQDHMQTTVSQQINGEKRKRISEGVIGQVSTHSGRKVTGAMIVPTSLSKDSPPIPEIAITTDKDGQYEWALPSGHYQITVMADGFREHVKKVEIKPNKVSTLDFILD